MRASHALGIEDGSLRATDPAIVELTAGTFFWIRKWRDQRPELSERDIANEMTDVFLSGLKR
jgi:hypothetical protein